MNTVVEMLVSADEVPDDWLAAKLVDVVQTMIAGVSVNADNRLIEGDEVGVLRTSCVSGGQFLTSEHKAVLPGEVSRVRTPVRSDSIIISRMNTPALVGANAYVDEDHPDLFLPDRLWQLRTNGHADCRWLSYFMKSATFRLFIDDIATGTSGSMKNISKERLLQLPLTLPPIDEQRRIAEVLWSVDEAIAAADVELAALRDVSNALIEKHCRATESEGCQPIGDFATFVGSGVTPKGGKDAYLGQGIAFIRSQNVHFDGLRAEGLAFIDQATYTKMARTRVKPDDVLLNITGASIGRCTIVPKDFGPANVNQHVCIIRPNPAVVLPSYLSIFLSSRDGQRQVDQLQGGLSREGLNFQQVRAISVPTPSLEVQSEISETMGALRSAMRTLERARAAKRAMRAGVSNDLLSGHVRVPA